MCNPRPSRGIRRVWEFCTSTVAPTSAAPEPIPQQSFVIEPRDETSGGSQPPDGRPSSHREPATFAAGDVRSGSIKRCASAVGEGAMAVSLVHQYLTELTR